MKYKKGKLKRNWEKGKKITEKKPKKPGKKTTEKEGSGMFLKGS